VIAEASPGCAAALGYGVPSGAALALGPALAGWLAGALGCSLAPVLGAVLAPVLGALLGAVLGALLAAAAEGA